MENWYYQSMSKQSIRVIGPMTLRQLRQAAVQGNIQSNSLVQSSGSNVWVSADRISGLFDAKGHPVVSKRDSATASWYFQSMGEIIGPVTQQELQQIAIQGKIQSDSLVRSANSTVWVSADRISGVFDANGLAIDSIKMPRAKRNKYYQGIAETRQMSRNVPKNGVHEEFFVSFYHWLKEVFSGRDPDGAIVVCVSAFGLILLCIVSAAGGFSGGDHQPSSRNISGLPSDMSEADYDYVSDRFRKEGLSEQDVDIATRAVNNAVKDRQNSRQYEDSSRYDSYDE